MITSSNSEIFITEIIPITENMIINHENINRMFNYLQQEVNLNKLASPGYYNRFRPIIGHFQPLYNDIQQLLRVQLPPDVLDTIAYQGLSGQSINPTNEIIGILGNISKFPTRIPENCAIIVIRYRDIIIGYISVIVDSRTTFDGNKKFFYIPAGKVAYFIGIRKSAALMAAQQYSKYLTNFGQSYRTMLTEFRLSESIIPAVEEYARTLNAVYLITTPLLNMMKILTKHYEFQGPQINTMLNRYPPPAHVMFVPDELIVWKKISYDKNDDY